MINEQKSLFFPLNDNHKQSNTKCCKNLALVNTLSFSEENKLLFIWIVLLCCSLSSCQQQCYIPIWELPKSALLPLLNLVQHEIRGKCSINQVADGERGVWRCVGEGGGGTSANNNFLGEMMEKLTILSGDIICEHIRIL